MPNSQIAPAKPISDSEILAMYEIVLPLLSYNPEKLEVANVLQTHLRTLVPFHFLHYQVEDAGSLKSLRTRTERRGGIGVETGSEIVVEMAEDTSDVFDERIAESYDEVREWLKAKYPDQQFHYHLIRSDAPPMAAIGIGRHVEENNDFTDEDIKRLDQLASHILLLFRTIAAHDFGSDAFQYFDSFAKIGSRIANEHGLSETEAKLLPDIVFGHSNEEIAERHFVSLATVKTHVNHILKKTGTKNRVDFISKFFTSPEGVQL